MEEKIIQGTADAYEKIVERFVAWAQAEEGIRAAVVIGSRARVDHPPDEWSDLDIIVFAREPKRYTSSVKWVENMGDYWLSFVEPTADGRALERRVLFEGGLDVDFAVAPSDFLQWTEKGALAADVADMVRRGIRVLLDKDGLLARFEGVTSVRQPPRMPTEQEYSEVVSDLWYHAVWTAKHLRRGELWWAKGGCDDHMKGLLRRMMEWHARATKGKSHDTWFRGRFLEEWADPRALKELRGAFAYYNEDDVWRALFVTMDLFRWMAVETANHFGYSYQTQGDKQATQFVKRLFQAKIGTAP